MRRAALTFVLLACVSSGASAGSCPMTRASRKASRVVRVSGEDAVRRALLARAANMEGEPDVLEPAATRDAFSVDVRRGWEEGGDSSRWTTSVVFVIGTRFVMVPDVARFANVLPPRCGDPRGERVLDAKIVRTGHRTLGVFRVQRIVSTEAATLPAVTGTRTDDCQDRTSYRIDDHVIDLATRRELLVTTGVYEGPLFEEQLPPVALPVLDDRGATYDDVGCAAISWRR